MGTTRDRRDGAGKGTAASVWWENPLMAGGRSIRYEGCRRVTGMVALDGAQHWRNIDSMFVIASLSG